MLIQDGNWRSELHRITELSVALLVVVMLVVASSAQMTGVMNINSYGVIKRLDWLHVDGQWIVDEDGNRMQLRGAGGDYYAYGRITTWLPTYIDWMKQTGCNVMRLAFCVPGYRVHNTEYDPAKMDLVLNMLEQNGIYAVLTSMHYWAVPEIQGWEDVMPNHESDWINCWVNIANRYKNRSVIAMYELLNEPFGSGYAELRDAYYRCIDAIRATGDKHIVCCSIIERTWIYQADGKNLTTPATWSEPTQIRANMCLNIHSWHGYNPDDWFKDDSSQVNKVAEMVASEWVATATYYRQKLGCPIVLGEFGTYNYELNHANLREMQLKIQMAEQLGIPWWAWMFDHWMQDNYSYKPNFWTTFVNQFLGGPFTSPYLAPNIPTYQVFDLHTFPALPFNIWTRINETQSTSRIREVGYNRWGVCMITIPQSNPVAFFGPCRLRVQVWGNSTQPYWGVMINDYYIDLAENETWTYPSVEHPLEGYTVIYAWEA